MSPEDFDRTIRMLDLVNKKIIQAIRDGKKFLCSGVIDDGEGDIPFHFAITDANYHDPLLKQFEINSKMVMQYFNGEITDMQKAYRNLKKASEKIQDGEKKEKGVNAKVKKKPDGRIYISFEK